MGRPWVLADLVRLNEMRLAGREYRECAVELGRTENTCRYAVWRFAMPCLDRSVDVAEVERKREAVRAAWRLGQTDAELGRRAGVTKEMARVYRRQLGLPPGVTWGGKRTKRKGPS